ncbi:hypothetical protein E4U41_003347 [Claviceps citrina]|nr:hypothetical protein E4U41_003347 [Claviceps citrina]
MPSTRATHCRLSDSSQENCFQMEVSVPVDISRDDIFQIQDDIAAGHATPQQSALKQASSNERMER